MKGKQIVVVNQLSTDESAVIMIDILGESKLIDALQTSGKINTSTIKNMWEGFLIQSIAMNVNGGVDLRSGTSITIR